MSDAGSMTAGGTRRLPSSAEGYELVEQIGTGNGSSGVVYRAMCQAIDDEVAVRIIDLDQLQASLEEVSKDIKCLPPATAIYVLHSTLKALDYFHTNNQIHRDVRASNILFDANGQVMLSDYGMMGWMVEGGWERKQRQTFVGTPCWMAPEILEQTRGYDYKADIWSLGITAIELAMGAAPYVRYAPMKVLVMTLQNPPPAVTGRAAEAFPEAYHDFVAACLQKDPDMRSSAKQLLAHPLFEKVEKPADLPSVLSSLPPVGSRGGAAQKMLYRQMQKATQPSGSGIWNKPSDRSGWDFSDEEGDHVRSSQLPPALGLRANADDSDASSAAPLTPSIPIINTEQNSLLSTSRSFRSTDEGTAVSAALPPTSALSETGSVSQDVPPTTPATTPAVTPRNLTAIPSFSPPIDGDSRVALPPSSGDVPAPLGAPSVVHIPSAVGHAAAAGGSNVVSSIGKSSGLQKKGRFTVSDVDVSGDKLTSKLNNFIDDDMEAPVPSSQPSGSHHHGGVISNSSSFTSLPGGPSSETSPTSAVQTPTPIVARAVLPSGIDSAMGQIPHQSHGPTIAVAPPPSAPVPKDGRKGRFEVSAVERGRSQASAPIQVTSQKPKSRFETKDIDPGTSGSDAPAGGPESSALYSKSPKVNPTPGALPSHRSKDAVPTITSRGNVPTSFAPLNSTPSAPTSKAPVPPSGVSLGPNGYIYSLTQCISALANDCELMRQENEILRKEVTHTRSAHEATINAFRQQLAHHQQLITALQSQQDKSTQFLQQKIQHLQRQQESSAPTSTRQPQQVVKLTQASRSQSTRQQSSNPSSGVATISQGSASQSSHLNHVGQNRTQLQSHHHQSASQSPVLQGAAAPQVSDSNPLPVSHSNGNRVQFSGVTQVQMPSGSVGTAAPPQNQSGLPNSPIPSSDQWKSPQGQPTIQSQPTSSQIPRPVNLPSNGHSGSVSAPDASAEASTHPLTTSRILATAPRLDAARPLKSDS